MDGSDDAAVPATAAPDVPDADTCLCSSSSQPVAIVVVSSAALLRRRPAAGTRITVIESEGPLPVPEAAGDADDADAAVRVLPGVPAVPPEEALDDAGSAGWPAIGVD